MRRASRRCRGHKHTRIYVVERTIALLASDTRLLDVALGTCEGSVLQLMDMLSYRNECQKGLIPAHITTISVSTPREM